MTLLEQRTIRWLKTRKKTIFDNISLDPEEELKKHIIIYSDWAIRKELMLNKNKLKDFDTIDFSKVLKSDAYVRKSDLPDLRMTDEDVNKLNECWYLIIPPFEEGVLKPNKDRYVWYKVTEIDEKSQSYCVQLADYANDQGIWIIENKAVGRCMWNAKWCDKTHWLYEVNGDRTSSLMEKHIKKYGNELGEDNTLYLSTVAIPVMKDAELPEDLSNLLCHFLLLMVKANIELQNNKPKAKRNSSSTIKTIAGEVNKNPKPRIIRTTSNGISFKSIKVPKSPSQDTIRKYTIEAWKTRGHIRHYKNGKITYVRESIHHRKCLNSDEPVTIPQTIIKIS